MLKAFQNHLLSFIPSIFEAKILIANSSGVDSMVLTDLCLKSNLNIALAHCNFKLRNSESDQDEKFISEYGTANDITIFCTQFETNEFAKTSKISTQMAARKLRYDWFDDLCQTHKFDYVFTAHHADDNLETFIINISRGSGIEGLLGIPKHNKKVLRPLLPFTRDQILEYATHTDIPWREDSSNSSLKYQRNQIRHLLTPALKNIFPDILHQLASTQAHLNSSNEILKNHIESVEEKVCRTNSLGDIEYDLNTLVSFGNPIHYVFPLFNKYGFTDWKALKNLLESQSGKQLLSPTHQLVKNRHALILSPIMPQNEFHMEVSHSDTEVQINHLNKILQLTHQSHFIENKKNTICVEGSLLKFPLMLRTWKNGDYFYPKGMHGKKKLSKFFKDQKLSIIEKSRVLVLCSENKIVWVVGFRADERFSAKKTSTSICQISLHNASS